MAKTRFNQQLITGLLTFILYTFAVAHCARRHEALFICPFACSVLVLQMSDDVIATPANHVAAGCHAARAVQSATNGWAQQGRQGAGRVPDPQSLKWP